MASLTVADRFVGPYPSEVRNKALRLESVGWAVPTIGVGVTPLITVLAGDQVLGVWNIITTTVDGGGGPGVTVGDDGVTDRYLVSHIVSAAAQTVYVYSAANTIDIVVLADTSAGAGTLHALIYRP